MRELFDGLIRFGGEVANAGLLSSTCGNASLRGEGRAVISGSGSDLERLTVADVAVVDLADGRHLSGPEPSMELEIHRGVYRARAGVGAVLHCQSRAATLLACAEDPPRSLDFIPEIPAYVRAHAYVPYHGPGSEGLAGAVCRGFEDPEVTVVQMVNHGQVIIGSTWQKVVRRATFFELGCWMAIQGLRLHTIPEEDVEILRGYSRDV